MEVVDMPKEICVGVEGAWWRGNVRLFSKVEADVIGDPSVTGHLRSFRAWT